MILGLAQQPRQFANVERLYWLSLMLLHAPVPVHNHISIKQWQKLSELYLHFVDTTFFKHDFEHSWYKHDTSFCVRWHWISPDSARSSASQFLISPTSTMSWDLNLKAVWLRYRHDCPWVCYTRRATNQKFMNVSKNGFQPTNLQLDVTSACSLSCAAHTASITFVVHNGYTWQVIYRFFGLYNVMGMSIGRGSLSKLQHFIYFSKIYVCCLIRLS